jgi:very-short-patch-repair endonuclease
VDADRRVADLAADQYAVFAQDQALACGMTKQILHRRLADGRLQQVQPRVYVMAGAPDSWNQRLLAACLAGGRSAAASHRSAGRLWGLLQDDQPIEITVPLRRAPRLRNTLVHRSTDLTAGQVLCRRGIPVTNPLRTMVDLGAVLGPEEVEAALDRGLIAQRFSVAAVEHALEQLARSGRAGCGVLRRVLRERALGDRRPDSMLEPVMARLLQHAGLPPGAFQYVIRDADGRFVGKADFAYPDRRLVVEVDGWSAHGTRTAFHVDRRRHNELVSAGWTLLRFTSDDLVRQPSVVAHRLRRSLHAESRQA